jgi:cell division protein ZapA
MSQRTAEPVSVQILDKDYLIACPAGERDDLQRAAALLGARLKEIGGGSKAMGTERLLIMAALNMANDLVKHKVRDERTATDVGGRVKSMRERVERALAHSQQLEL